MRENFLKIGITWTTSLDIKFFEKHTKLHTGEYELSQKGVALIHQENLEQNLLEPAFFLKNENY